MAPSKNGNVARWRLNSIFDFVRYLKFSYVDHSASWAGADPGILERGTVRGQSPEPSAEGASAGGGLEASPRKF